LLNQVIPILHFQRQNFAIFPQHTLHIVTPVIQPSHSFSSCLPSAHCSRSNILVTSRYQSVLYMSPNHQNFRTVIILTMSAPSIRPTTSHCLILHVFSPVPIGPDIFLKIQFSKHGDYFYQVH
jgi:hypothetical protein